MTRASCQVVSVVLGVCACLLVGRSLPARAQAAPVEGRVVVQSMMTAQGTTDFIEFEIVGNTREAPLQDILGVLGTKFQATPTNFVFFTPDPDYLPQPTLGARCQLPVVPRGTGYLPIAPFIEAFAPHVDKLGLLYLVHGPFTYRGYQAYTNSDVAFTVKAHPAPDNSVNPLAFYSVDVIIKDRSLTTVSIPRYPQPESHTPWWMILAWVVIVGLLGAAVGVVLTRLLPRAKAKAAAADQADSTNTRRPS